MNQNLDRRDGRARAVKFRMSSVAWRGGVVACLVAIAGLAVSAQEAMPDSEPPASSAGTDTGSDAAAQATGSEVEVEQPLDAERFAWVPIRNLSVQYVAEYAGLPTIEEMLDMEIPLSVEGDGLIAAQPDRPTQVLTLRELCDGTVRRHSLDADGSIAGSIDAICQAIYTAMINRGYAGVLVAPDPDQIDPSTREDIRFEYDEDDDSLRIFVYIAVISDVRTVASGERVSEDERINAAKHARIRRLSPVKPSSEDETRAYIQRRQLDDYVLRLNRHPGRRVDIAIAPTADRGTALLDYLVAENKPLTLYAQLSNTGTKQTEIWRQRFGLTHTQLLGRDDILSLDYITAGFSEAHALLASYDMPVFDSERLRFKVYGNFSDFDASNVGLADETFSGESWTLGAELTQNVYQNRDFFIDAFVGARWQDIEVINEAAQEEGQDAIFVPRIGVRAEQRRDTRTLGGSIAFESNLPGIAGSEEEDLEKLGRLDVDEDWVVLQWDAGISFFLEPLIDRAAWATPRVPAQREPGGRYPAGLSTLAHEIVLNVRGQYAFDYRLIPNAEQVVGGLYSVRGYPESVVAGDSVIIGTAEYRFHVPRALSIQPEPSKFMGRDFRARPQQQFGRPDWDLVLRAFVDAARVTNSDRLSFERDETLVGAGLGAELLLYQNVSVRMDWGMALEEVQNQDVKVGSNRFHFVFTVLF